LQVIKALNLYNVTLLGHSTAGAVAVRYMARHNGFGVSKLVLCAAAAPRHATIAISKDWITEEL